VAAVHSVTAGVARATVASRNSSKNKQQQQQRDVSCSKQLVLATQLNYMDATVLTGRDLLLSTHLCVDEVHREHNSQVTAIDSLLLQLNGNLLRVFCMHSLGFDMR